MPQSVSSLPLRAILAADAATCAVMGLVLILAAGLASALTGLPAALLYYSGVILIPIAIFIAAIASRPVPPHAGVWLVVAGNVLWIAASLLLLVSGWVSPNGLGYIFVVVQAGAVAVLSWLEYGALNGTSASLQTG